MKNFRFKFVIAVNFFYILRTIPKINRMLKSDKYTDQEYFDYAYKIINRVRKKARTRTDTFGLENVPKEDGYILYSNHQGKYDALGILLSLEGRPCSVLWEKKQATRLLSRQIVGLIRAIPIDLTDMKEKVRAISEVTKEVSEGRSFLIFPEGGYKDNHNNLQEFQHGCFSVALKSKAPIVPVAIYDSYKSLNSNTLERVVTQVHFLKPIYKEEYEGLSKQELSELVKARIAEKLNEIAIEKEKQKKLKKQKKKSNSDPVITEE